MLLNTASPRKSFSIPININLQGARRRQTREVLHTGAAQDLAGREGEKAKSQMTVSSVGEDRAVLLAFAMMAFAVLMFFVVGIIYVKPYLNSHWDEEANCSLVQSDVLEEWVDCRGVSMAPCLRVLVNITQSGQKAHFHYDEESVLLNPLCFYVPKCQRDRKELESEVHNIKSYLEELRELGNSLTCLTNPGRYPEDAILTRQHTLRQALFSLLWPCLMLAGGTLLVVLVKLNQRLDLLCSELQGRGQVEGRQTSTHTRGKLYQVLNHRSGHSPMQDDEEK
ncbi:calcium-activated potassium channel subunit beta-3 [Hypomesus transpacificus]|uniref:calcium-activated potassium channel subunit beta-3 n=1 Tax=Hypomesus transpacificus TaxID=137520 RepID=UPI001F085958|nr:calcium-activated potassium channel subunit beta-3 [Hypomesus transpacificus]